MVAAGVAVVAVVVGIALAEREPNGTPTTSAAPQIALQAATVPGPDPFTASVVVASAPAPSPASSGGPSATGTVDGGTIDGGTVGLYGGTERTSSCDVGRLSDFLTTHADKGQAWAQVEGIPQDSIASYLHSLTSALLRVDTRVTNHGFADGAATGFQSVLQAGTAVLVDNRGVPRARCACGNPLLPPVAQSGATYGGGGWPSFQPGGVVSVTPAAAPVSTIVMVDSGSGKAFARPVGSSGNHDVVVPLTGPSGSSTAGSRSYGY